MIVSTHRLFLVAIPLALMLISASPEPQARVSDEARIAELRQTARTLRDEGDGAGAAEAALQANFLAERLALGPGSEAQLESKYRALRAAVGEEEEAARSPLVYHPLELDAVLQVVRDFGELVIRETPPEGASVKVPMPWSGYWYPRRSRDMFDGENAPLAKVERLARAAGRDVSIVEWEKNRYQTFYTDSWEGMCGSWAMASVTSAEPTQDKVYQGVTFTVADQKALLTKSREAFPTKFYGVRYDGDADTDGTYQDLRPEAFHIFAMKMIGERQRAFVIDEDPGIEVWSKPVYRVRWVIKKDTEKPNALVVQASVWMTRERNSETAVPTSIDNRTAVIYDYRLYYDPATSRDGNYRIIAGEWLEGSRRAHPDMVMIPDPAGAWASANPGFNSVMDIVKAIVGG